MDMQQDKTVAACLLEIAQHLSGIEQGMQRLEKAVVESERASWFHFLSTIGFFATGVGLTLEFVSPERAIGWFTANWLGLILVVIGLAILLSAVVKYKPENFRVRLAWAGIILMVLGTVLGSVVQANRFPVAGFQALYGWLILALGLLLTFIAWRPRSGQERGDTQKPNDCNGAYGQ